MILCSADSSHFDRLRPARAPSAVLTSAWDSVPLVSKRPQRRPHASRASPAAAKKLIPSLHAVPEEPASSSRFESRNRFAVLASDDPDPAAVPESDLNHVPSIAPTCSLATSCTRRHLARKPRCSPPHPGCYLPTGPRPLRILSRPPPCGTDVLTAQTSSSSLVRRSARTPPFAHSKTFYPQPGGSL